MGAKWFHYCCLDELEQQNAKQGHVVFRESPASPDPGPDDWQDQGLCYTLVFSVDKSK